MNGGMPSRRQQTPEVTVVEKPLPVALEDLFTGCTKKLKIKRKTFDNQTNKQSVEDRILEVPIKKGLKPGSKIKFAGVGDQVEGGVQDLHFVVEEVSNSQIHVSENNTDLFYRKSTPYTSAKATTSSTTSRSL